MKYIKYKLVEINGRIVTPLIKGIDGGYFYDGTWRYGTCDDGVVLSDKVVAVSEAEYNKKASNSRKSYGRSLLDELKGAFPALSEDIETLKSKAELTVVKG